MLLSDGDVACWGDNSCGELGDETLQDRRTPVRVHHVAHARLLGANGVFTCVTTDDAPLACFGANHMNQLGRALAGTPKGARCSEATPLAANGLLKVAPTELALGGAHGCARAGGEVQCWGSFVYGERGDGQSVPSSAVNVPLGIAEPGRVSLPPVRHVAAGSDHVCAVTTVGAVLCWGRNELGQIGDGTLVSPRPLPTAVIGLPPVETIALGRGQSCALTLAGAVWCWGEKAPVAHLVPDVRATQISLGSGHACALEASGAVLCWGDNFHGQLGDGTAELRKTPTRVIELPPAKSVAAGGRHTCAETRDDAVFCWGENRDGQLGDDTVEQRNAPVRVHLTL